MPSTITLLDLVCLISYGPYCIDNSKIALINFNEENPIIVYYVCVYQINLCNDNVLISCTLSMCFFVIFSSPLNSNNCSRLTLTDLRISYLNQIKRISCNFNKWFQLNNDYSLLFGCLVIAITQSVWIKLWLFLYTSISSFYWRIIQFLV